MDRLCRKGLGTLWLDKDDQLHLPQYYNLVGQRYELCRAGGLSHHMIVPLAIEDDEMVPSLERPFWPHFTVNALNWKEGPPRCLHPCKIMSGDLSTPVFRQLDTLFSLFTLSLGSRKLTADLGTFATQKLP